VEELAVSTLLSNTSLGFVDFGAGSVGGLSCPCVGDGVISSGSGIRSFIDELDLLVGVCVGDCIEVRIEVCIEVCIGVCIGVRSEVGVDVTGARVAVALG
jgi:hypothetical protein